MLIYKRGKGTASRGICIFFLGIMLLFGCRELRLFLLDRALTPIQITAELELGWADLITGLIGAGCAAGIFLLLNSRRVVDFLLETEAELKKVSWSSREQIFGNTVVVIVSVIVLALFILASDKVISKVIMTILR